MQWPLDAALPQDPTWRYQTITGIANTTIGHDNEDETGPLVVAAIDNYCPQHRAIRDEVARFQ